jgi:ribosomal protein S18 acetylase RimI-like enzyme
MIIEAATEADARAIGVVHVLAWHETYRGIVPDSVLASLNPAARAERWLRVIGTEGGVFVLRAGPRIVGFAAAGPNRDEQLPQQGEIYTLYLLSEAQRQGHGRRLMSAMAADLRRREINSVALWVAEANLGACRFFETLGGTILGHNIEKRGTWTLPCVAYGWDDRAGLIQERP